MIELSDVTVLEWWILFPQHNVGQLSEAIFFLR